MEFDVELASPEWDSLQTPIISIEPHSASVRAGSSASFKCRVYSGAQPVRLEWKMANNRPLPANAKISRDGSVITISNAQPSSRGSYHCVASNLFGITQSIVSLNSPPWARGPVRVRVGDPIVLECQSSGEPRPVVSWHRLGIGRKTLLSSPVPMESNAVLERGCLGDAGGGGGGGGSRLPVVPRAVAPDPLLIVAEGQTTTLRLVLPNVGRQDSGEYICNATNHLGTSEVIVTLDVETIPYATAIPDDVAVRVGEVIRLQCLAHGTPPLRYTWTKLEGSLPPRAQVTGGDLQINLATAADAGSYKCSVDNHMGHSETVAKVTVRSPLAVRISPQVEVKALGGTVEFTCSAAGGTGTYIEWLREGQSMPTNHHVKDGVLRIENLEQSDEGIYICRATNEFGQAQDSAKLTIQALPKVTINVRTAIQTVMVGHAVEFECQAIGDPQPTVRWSKVGGTLPAHIVVTDGVLRISQVTEADAGEYRCTATNDVGSVQSQVVLNVQ
ncbi:hypothetical protein CRUP_003877, partial [Coryphaenoides rupestris]